jgi:hypothetical protein
LKHFKTEQPDLFVNIKGRDVSTTDIKKENHIQHSEHKRRDARFSLFIKILEYEHLHLSLSALLTSMSSDNLSVNLSVVAPLTHFTVGPTLS